MAPKQIEMEKLSTKRGHVPKLRFKEFEGGYELKVLKDLIDIRRKIRYGIVQPGNYDPNGRLMIRGQDYSSVKGWAEISEFFKVSVEVEKKYKNARVKSGDLLITIVGAGTGWMEVVPDFLEGANITQTTGRIAIDNFKASAGYIKDYFFSQNGKKEISKHIKGQAQPGLNIGDIELFNLITPTLPEQQKIASFLSAVDEKIRQLTRKKQRLELYKKGVMQKLFSQELRFKDENGKEYPRWEEKRLGELGRFTGGGTPSSENEEFWGGSIPWISSSDIFENDIKNISVTRYITEEALEQSATKKVPANSLLFVSRVGIGKLAINYRVVCTSQDFTSFTPNEISVDFIGYFFISNKNLLLRHAQGTSIKGFTTADLKEIRIEYPQREEQQKIATFLSSLDEKIEKVGQQIEKTQRFKKGLLQQMFF